MFWDIILSDMWNIPPWEVRENITQLDIARLGIWRGAKNSAEQIESQQREAKMKMASQSNRRRR